MLDQLHSNEGTQQPPLSPSIPAACAEKCSSNMIYVWLGWEAESIALVRAAQNAAELENFRLIDIHRTSTDSHVWRCQFEQAALAPGLEQRTQGLLKRLGAIGRCIRAERVFQRAAPSDEHSQDFSWEAFARKPLAGN